MKLKFAANLNWLFKELKTLPERYQAAKSAGFIAVESADPYDIPIEKLKEAKEASLISHVLMNVWPGDVGKGERGLAAIPNRQTAFRDSLETAIKYCEALDCHRLHIMAGCKTPEHDAQTMKATYIDNLRYASDRLSKHSILALIEPINTAVSLPNYYLDSLDDAISIIDEVNHPNLKLQMDLFHIQIMHGNLTKNLEKYLHYIGHIQIAQVPDRHGPASAGEINYPYIFDLLEKLGYDGYIGLEYIPEGETSEDLEWFYDYIKK